MVLHSRPLAKSAAAMAATSTHAAPSRPAAAPKATPPRVLQSGHAPAQLCFFFKRG